MEEPIKQTKSKSHKDFEVLLNQDWANRKVREGEIITGVVSEITKKHVWINLNLKSEAAIPIEEFYSKTREIEKIKVGEQIKVLLEKIENKNGDVVASREKCRKLNSWKKLEKAFQDGEKVSGQIVSRIKGGFAVQVESCLAFLPGSQLSTRPLNNEEISKLMKEPQSFEVCKLDKRRGNLVLSRRSIEESKKNKSRDEEIAKLKEGMIIENAIVKALTSWGAFLMVNNLETLCHINEISWSRVTTPGDLLHVGQKLRCMILTIDKETKKVNTTIKRLQKDPYIEAIKKYKAGTEENYEGVITAVTEYGAFCRLTEGLEGLIHQSEIDFLKPKIHPGKKLSVSQKVKVRILSIDHEKRRLSLSYMRTMADPWDDFCKKFKTNGVVKATCRNVTDYALFCDIEDTEIVGMVHFRELDYSEQEDELQKYKKGDVLSLKILEIDREQKRVRLSKKHMDPDPFEYWSAKSVGDIVTVTVERINNQGIYVYGGKKGFPILIKKNQLGKSPENQRSSRFVPKQKVDCCVSELKKDARKIKLSIKMLEEKESAEAVKKFGSTSSGQILGEILGPLLKKKNKK